MRLLRTNVHGSTGYGAFHLRAGMREDDLPEHVREARATRPARNLLDALRGFTEPTDQPLLGDHVWRAEDDVELDVSDLVAAGPGQVGDHPRAASLVVQP